MVLDFLKDLEDLALILAVLDVQTQATIFVNRVTAEHNEYEMQMNTRIYERGS